MSQRLKHITLESVSGVARLAIQLTTATVLAFVDTAPYMVTLELIAGTPMVCTLKEETTKSILLILILNAGTAPWLTTV